MSIKIIHGDALLELKKMKDKSVRLVISSPPYCLGKEYEKNSSYDEYKHLMQNVCNELFRVVMDGGSLCWQVGNRVDDGAIHPLDYFFYPLFMDLGLRTSTVKPT